MTIDGPQSSIVKEMYLSLWILNGTRFPVYDIFLNEPGETFFRANRHQSFIITNGGRYSVSLTKKKYHRLGPPYSKCGRNGQEKNIFGGLYTVDKCRETCMVRVVNTTCGVLPQIYRKILRLNGTFSEYRNKSTEFSACLQRVLANSEAVRPCMERCLPPCEEIRYGIQKTYTTLPTKSSLVFMPIRFSSLSHEVYRQVPATTIISLVSNFGGLVSLMVGSSILSILEVCVYISLLLLAKFNK